METTDFGTIIGFTTGATSLAKKLGIQGDWLVLVAFLAGGFATTLSTYQPDLWHSVPILIATIGTIASGNVSLVNDLIKKWSGQAQ